MKLTRILVIPVLLLLAGAVSAQNNAGKTDDVGRVALTPFIAENSNIPTASSNLMRSKMRAAVPRRGLGPSAGGRFILPLTADVVSRKITPTAPPMVATVLSPTFYIGDLSDGTLFASLTLPAVKGVGQNEEKSYMQALKNINLNNPDFAKFVGDGKEKIIAYYNTHIDFIIKEADALSGKGEHERALALLMGVPTVCADAHARAMKHVGTVYQRKIDQESAEALARATGAWAASPDATGATEAGEWLAGVHPLSSSAPGAAKLQSEMKSRVKELADREWTEQVKQNREEAALAQTAMQAAKEIAAAEANRPVYYTTVLSWW